MKKIITISITLTLLMFFACEKSMTDIKLIPVKSGSKWGYVNYKGEFVINPQFDQATTFQDGIAKVMISGTEQKYGYIGTDGKYIINPIYSSATAFSEGIAIVTTENSEPIYIDKEGNTLFSIKTVNSGFVFSDHLSMYKEYVINSEKESEELLYGFINEKGERIVPAQYKNAKPFSNGLAAVMNNDDLWGYIDTGGKLVINFQFQDAELFSDEIAVVFNGETWGAINNKGKYIINPQFEKLSKFSEHKAIYILNGKRGYIDSDGEIIINAQYDQAKPFSNGLACVSSNGYWGYIDSKGKFEINPQFKEASSFYGSFAIVKSGDKYGIINKKGEFTANPQFNDVYQILMEGPNYENIGVLSYNDLYVNTRFFDVYYIIDKIITSVSNVAVNEIRESSKTKDVVTYLNGLSKTKIDTSDFNSYDTDMQINDIGIDKEVIYTVAVNFEDPIMRPSKNGNYYDDYYNKKYIINNNNTVNSILFEIVLSGKTEEKANELLHALESRFDFLEKSKENDPENQYFFSESYDCQILSRGNKISIMIDFEKSISTAGNPQKVAREFMEALGERNYKKAKNLGTDNTVMMIGMIESMASMGEETDYEEPPKLVWGETEIQGNKAVCYYESSDKPGVDQRLDLVKQNGKWKVDMKKEM